MPLVSSREYARMRGVAEVTVRNAMKSGKLVNAVIKSEAGSKKIILIDSDLADKEWPVGAHEATIKEKAKRPFADDDANAEAHDYSKARAKREAYQAELAKLSFDEKAGKLVDAEEVKKAWVSVASITRTKVMGLPSKIKQRIPSLTHDDYLTIKALVRESLEDLADGESSTDG